MDLVPAIPLVNVDVDLVPVAPPPPPVELRRSQRTSQQPGWLNDFVTYNVRSSSQDLSSSSSPPTFPFIVSPHLTNQYMSFLASGSHIKEPSSFVQAQQDPIWVYAMLCKRSSKH
ncbi:hypothetical protein Sjap_017688 [Stephania japonica]|uniref:Uncharacterized protein n=1 Tax=Stephania japonica TaxID=461633 RepID=A0AAP0NJR7_9MAGN